MSGFRPGTVAVGPHFATRLKRARRAHKLSQQDLSNMTGLRTATISDLETGRTKYVTPRTVCALAEALALQPDYFFGRPLP